MDEYIEREKAIELIQPHVKPQTVYGEGYMQAIEHATEILTLLPAADVQPVNQWISVEDRLPDNGVEVIVNEVDMGIIIGWYDTNAEEFQCDTFSPLEVTHWMPLPEPPKNGGTDDEKG